MRARRATRSRASGLQAVASFSTRAGPSTRSYRAKLAVRRDTSSSQSASQPRRCASFVRGLSSPPMDSATDVHRASSSESSYKCTAVAPSTSRSAVGTSTSGISDKSSSPRSNWLPPSNLWYEQSTTNCSTFVSTRGTSSQERTLEEKLSTIMDRSSASSFACTPPPAAGQTGAKGGSADGISKEQSKV